LLQRKINYWEKILWAPDDVQASAVVKAEWLQPAGEDTQKYKQP